MTDLIVCVLCKHWDFDPGEADWSEYTPGYDWEHWCGKDVFPRTGGHDCSQWEFRKQLLSANSCKHYEEVS